MNRTAIPWILTVILALYVLGLEYLGKNGTAFDPTFEFYDTAQVSILVHGSVDRPPMGVFGEYNNVLEGEKQIVKGRSKGQDFRLSFRVNSPRRAYLFANDEKLEIFLIPGDTSLKVHLYWDSFYDGLDSVAFEGQTASICEYYAQKAQKFEEVNLITARHTFRNPNYDGFVARLDSAVAHELLFLGGKEITGELPPWFAMFEKNEILYNRIYLILTNAKNLRGAPDELPTMQISNPRAVFSYYYYLYLHAHFANLLQKKGDQASAFDVSQELALACAQLEGEVKDVYLSRIISRQLKRTGPNYAEQLLSQHKEEFSSQRYVRFLQMSIQAKQDSLQAFSSTDGRPVF